MSSKNENARYWSKKKKKKKWKKWLQTQSYEHMYNIFLAIHILYINLSLFITYFHQLLHSIYEIQQQLRPKIICNLKGKTKDNRRSKMKIERQTSRHTHTPTPPPPPPPPLTHIDTNTRTHIIKPSIKLSKG